MKLTFLHCLSDMITPVWLIVQQMHFWLWWLINFFLNVFCSLSFWVDPVPDIVSARWEPMVNKTQSLNSSLLTGWGEGQVRPLTGNRAWWEVLPSNSRIKYYGNIFRGGAPAQPCGVNGGWETSKSFPGGIDRWVKTLLILSGFK